MLFSVTLKATYSHSGGLTQVCFASPPVASQEGSALLRAHLATWVN